MAFYSSFPKYVSVAERKQQALDSIEKLRKKNPEIAPVIVTGKSLARTWWGKSWNLNLESYADYSNRIARGRAYCRNGAVLDLQITHGSISALVQGSGSKPYKIIIAIQPLAEKNWDSLTKEFAGKMDSLQELIAGKFPKGLAELFTAREKGMFPTPDDIHLNCNCHDGAKMCKHLAAVLYGVGARLDDDPTLFFKLRGVNVEALISETITKQTQSLLEKSKKKSRRVMEESDATDIFDL
jgi:uncharacterized Zn finger protein